MFVNYLSWTIYDTHLSVAIVSVSILYQLLYLLSLVVKLEQVSDAKLLGKQLTYFHLLPKNASGQARNVHFFTIKYFVFFQGLKKASMVSNKTMK